MEVLYSDTMWIYNIELQCQMLFLFFQLKQKETKTYSLAIEEDVPVRNLKPAVVKVYDYYQTSKNSI